MGNVVTICVSSEKGTVKTPTDRALVVRDHGIQGDAHAGPWHRQVSLLAVESIDRMRKIMPEIAGGAFAENVVTRGIDLGSVRIGDQLRLGQRVLLEITQIGKECHRGCAIREKTGDCIMPREGVFCRVFQGGVLKPGDPVERLVGVRDLEGPVGRSG